MDHYIGRQEDFDEVGYLRMYPDVAEAVAKGIEPSGWHHYVRFGREEGRRTTELDPDFYLRSYPLAAVEIRAGRATTADEHYVKFGRARGYLPHARAERPSNAANWPSTFGGLWIDLSHADDLIDGKFATGLITARQADLLRRFRRDGYVILEGAIPPELLSRARGELEAAYDGKMPELLFECAPVSSEHIRWKPEIDPFPAKALDIHHFAPAIREMIFSDKVSEFLGLIFESKAFASQTLGFLRGSAQESHQDSAFVVYSLPRQFAATWIALEDVTEAAGELFYYPGSHRFPDFLYSGAYKSVSEAKRNTGAEGSMREQIERHVQSLDDEAQRRGIRKETFLAKGGDVLVWHADLVHGGCPVSTRVTRKSVVTHYCPKFAAPAFAESTQVKLSEQDGHCFTTSYYNSPPVGHAQEY